MPQSIPIEYEYFLNKSISPIDENLKVPPPLFRVHLEVIAMVGTPRSLVLLRWILSIRCSLAS